MVDVLQLRFCSALIPAHTDSEHPHLQTFYQGNFTSICSLPLPVSGSLKLYNLIYSIPFLSNVLCTFLSSLTSICYLHTTKAAEVSHRFQVKTTNCCRRTMNCAQIYCIYVSII